MSRTATAPARLLVLRVLVVALLATLLGRLVLLQVVDGSNYTKAASANRVRDVVVPAAARRGLRRAGPAAAHRPHRAGRHRQPGVLLRQPHDGAECWPGWRRSSA